MKCVDQKCANRVGGVFHAPMQATCSNTEPAHYFQHGHLPLTQRHFSVDWRLHADGFLDLHVHRSLRGSTNKSNRLTNIAREREGGTRRHQRAVSRDRLRRVVATISQCFDSASAPRESRSSAPWRMKAAAC